MRCVIGPLVLLASLVAGCGNSLSGPSDSVATGVWGGDGIQVTVTDKGAAIEHDCDSGKINAPLILDHSGQFSIDGTYSFGHGGPRQPDEPPAKSYTAHYSGTVNGNTMRLSISLPELSKSIGEFTLELGKPMLGRCL